MIIVKEGGGLGNQMFQYAYGRKVSSLLKVPLKLDISAFIKKDYLSFQKDTVRPFYLDQFNIKAEVATDSEIKYLHSFSKKLLKKIKGKILGHPNPYFFNENELRIADNSYSQGFWQREEYFADLKEELKKEFTLRDGLCQRASLTQLKIEEIKAGEYSPVALHVRRGDYTLTSSGFNSVAIDYYKKAIALIDEKVWGKKEFLIFSDDIPWAEQHIVPLLTHHNAIIVYQEGLTVPEELFLMSTCSHFIIANSTFSWWGAWLGETAETVVVAPHQWSQTAGFPSSPVPQRWCTIKE